MSKPKPKYDLRDDSLPAVRDRNERWIAADTKGRHGRVGDVSCSRRASYDREILIIEIDRLRQLLAERES